ncbi:MAG: BrnA antitoxin family protein [Pseudomonas sp.]|uniref:BrnA antitoxin family protein n=1 Tax=Pseudomonas sp. TaxID=306 RepID=UPI00273453E4|nr:BrnA antitoxin family protein [Pseudomonas sp.]MDP3846306.1 BrnA antitoxin family protein [Pseudomonas sp.]
MSRKPNPELIDNDNPEWTADDFANATPFAQLPASLRKTLSSRARGPQKAPTKEALTVRYSPEVLARFKASGPGWQTRMDAALKDWLQTHDPRDIA